jgi:hypothetical protein
VQPGGRTHGGGNEIDVDEQEVRADPDGPGERQPGDAGLERGLKPLSGQRSHTSESWSIVVKMAPASASVAGNAAPAREDITQKPVDDLGLSRSAYERQLAQRIRPSVSVNHKRRQPEATCSRRLRLQVSLIQH